jgi:hypothetical protein
MAGIKATQIVVYKIAIGARGFIIITLKYYASLPTVLFFVASLCQAGNKFWVFVILVYHLKTTNSYALPFRCSSAYIP